jgi:hypothetical protein
MVVVLVRNRGISGGGGSGGNAVSGTWMRISGGGEVCGNASENRCINAAPRRMRIASLRVNVWRIAMGEERQNTGEERDDYIRRDRWVT